MKTVIGGILFLVLLFSVQAAELTVPRFEMVTLGRTLNGDFSLASSVSLDLSLSGGYKYALALGFSFNSSDLAKTLAYRNFRFQPFTDPVMADDLNDLTDQINDMLNNQGTLSFRMVRASISDLFKIPLELSFFIGEGDDFCSGDEYTTRFGYDPIGTEYKGLFYFPSGINGDINRRYNGIYGVRGTGLSLAFTKWNNFIPMIYFYESYSPFAFLAGTAGKPMFSGDFRFLLNYDSFKLEGFTGLSYMDSLIVRGGLLAHFYAGRAVEFLIQAGLSGWDLEQKLNIDNFFFLMEPRFRFGIFGINLTIFYHPVIYNNLPTPAEQGKADINLNFFAQIPGLDMRAGIEGNMSMKVDKMDDFTLFVAPYATFFTGGLLWDVKLRVNFLGKKIPQEMFEIFIGVKSSF